eukprot:304623_1
MEVGESIYYKYTSVIVWCITSSILSIILVIESVTYYRFLYPQQKTTEIIESAQNETKKDDQTNEIEIMHMSNSSLPAPSSPGSISPTPSHESVKSQTYSATNNTSSNIAPKPRKLLLLMPLCSYLLFSITGIVSMIYTLNLIFFEGCKYGGIIASIFYALGKTMMYFVFIYRIYNIYCDSTFAYNTKILFTMVIIIIIWTLINIIVNTMTVHEFKDEINGSVFCGVNILLPVAGSSALLDMIINFLCCYLFTKPLLKLTHMEVDGHSSALKSVIVKFTILTFTAVISTVLLSVMVGITKLSTFGAVDVIINCFCIMFFNKQYHHYYKIICCGAIQICNKLCQSSKKRNGVNMMVL